MGNCDAGTYLLDGDDLEVFVWQGAASVKARVIAAYDEWASGDKERVCPHTVAEWAGFLSCSGVDVVPVAGRQDFFGALTESDTLGLVVMVNCVHAAPDQRRTLCRCFCEYLMLHCKMLGQDAPEVFPMVKAAIRARIAARVACELC